MSKKHVVSLFFHWLLAYDWLHKSLDKNLLKKFLVPDICYIGIVIYIKILLL